MISSMLELAWCPCLCLDSLGDVYSSDIMLIQHCCNLGVCLTARGGLQAVEDLIAAAGAEDAELSEKEPQEQHAVVATADHSSANHRQPSSIREPQQTSAETAPHPTEACPDASVSEAAGAVGQDDDLQADDESFVVDEIRPEPPAKQVKSGKPVAKHKGAEKGTGRNQRCSCGSHKKFKNCCGAARSRASAGAAIAEQQQQSTPSANPLYV